MLTKNIRLFLSILVVCLTIGSIDLKLLKANEFPFGVYGAFQDYNSILIGRDSLYRQISGCGFNLVFVGIDSATKDQDLSSIKKAGLKAYFIGLPMDAPAWYSGGHYTKWRVGDDPIAGFSMRHQGGYDSTGVMIWRANDSTSLAGVIVDGPIRIDKPDSGYNQCNTYQWYWNDTLGVPWKASFRLRTTDNSGFVTVAIISVIMRGVDHSILKEVSDTLFSNDFPNTDYTDFTIKYSFCDSSFCYKGWVLGRAEFRIHWFKTRDLYVDKIEAYDDTIGEEIISKTDSVATLIKNYAINFKDSTQVAGFLLADEPPTIDRLNTYRFVDSLFNEIDSTKRGITAYAENLGDEGPPLAKYFIQISKPYIFMDDCYPLSREWSGLTPQGKLNELCKILDTLREETILAQKEFYYISQAFHQISDSTTYWTNPTPSEMECFINLGLAYKVDGIVLFRYNDTYTEHDTLLGLVAVKPDSNYVPRENWYRVQSIAPKVKKIGSILRNLSWQGTFIDDSTNDLFGHGGGYLDSINSSAEPHWVQVGFFKSANNDTNYFMLVNRECGANEGANYNVFVTGVPYRVRDMYTDSIVGNVNGNGDYFTVYLGPGEGKLFRLEERYPGERIKNVPGEYSTIQAAINASLNGDTVLVAPGTYYENINFHGKVITVASQFIFNHDSSTIDRTIINGSDVYTSVVRFESGESFNSTLIGFTLTGAGLVSRGKALEQQTPFQGGGIYCGANSSPTITNNKIIENTLPSTQKGGGIASYNSSPKIVNNLILNNFCGINFGGGIYLEGGSPLIINNTLVNNRGGGIAIFGSGGHPVISNNIIVKNTDGGGIRFGTSCPACTTILSNDVWNNPNGNFVNCPAGMGDTSWGSNFNRTPCDKFYNIIRKPMFVDSLANYHLLASSPCINAGNDNAPGLPSFDFDFHSRITGCNVDMGAYEFWYLCGDANGDNDISSADIVYLINYLFKGGPSPNPIQSGDANCDGRVTSADTVYLVNFLFKGGPAPCAQ